MTDFRIIQGSSPAALTAFESESIHSVVTSPPYFGLRDYGTEPLLWGGDPDCEHVFESKTKTSGGAYKPGSKKRWQHSADEFGRDDRFLDGHPQIPAGAACSKCGAWKGNLGLEPTPLLFVRNLVEVFQEVWRVLRKDGTLWLNMGDSYAGSWGNYHPNSPPGKHGQRGKSTERFDRPGYQSQEFLPPTANVKALGMKPKDLMGMPWRVAFALQDAGWYLRQDIIWSKPNPMPESVGDRCTKAHEYIFLLTKSAKYFYDAEAIKEETAPPTGGRQRAALRNDSRYVDADFKDYHEGRTGRHQVYQPENRNKRSVWTVATQPYSEAHFATFPPKLIEPCILAGTSERGACSSCAAPFERVLKKAPYTGDKMPDGWDTGEGHHESFHRNGREKGQQPNRDQTAGNRNGEGDSTLDAGEIPQTETVGWRPTCKCSGLDLIGDYPVCPQPGNKPLAVYAEIVTKWRDQAVKWDMDWKRLAPMYAELSTEPCVVLDPFAGSGTTLMVATMHRRRSIGVELNPKYIEIAERRLKDVQMQLF
jgi:DNA modification methylase